MHRGVRNSEANQKDLKQHRADVAEAKNADYTKEVNGYIDKKFSEKTFLGQPKKYGVDEIKKGLTPFLNNLVKKQKHLKTKAQGTSPAVTATLLELDAARLKLSQATGQANSLKADYMDAINSKRSDSKKDCRARRKELERWNRNLRDRRLSMVKTSIYSIQKPKNQIFNHRIKILSRG